MIMYTRSINRNLSFSRWNITVLSAFLFVYPANALPYYIHLIFPSGCTLSSHTVFSSLPPPPALTICQAYLLSSLSHSSRVTCPSLPGELITTPPWRLQWPPTHTHTPTSTCCTAWCDYSVDPKLEDLWNITKWRNKNIKNLNFFRRYNIQQHRFLTFHPQQRKILPHAGVQAVMTCVVCLHSTTPFSLPFSLEFSLPIEYWVTGDSNLSKIPAVRVRLQFTVSLGLSKRGEGKTRHECLSQVLHEY